MLGQKNKFKQTEIGEIPKDWDVKYFRDLAQLSKQIFDPKREKVDANDIYLGLEHFNQGGFSLNGLGQVSDIESNKYRFSSGDILFGKLRPYFKKLYQPKFDGICSTDIWVLRPKKDVDSKYLFYLTATRRFLNKTIESSKGTKMPRASWDFVSNQLFPKPLLSEQKRIASVLSPLDDKIELNRKMNKTLEEIGKALFKRWFVDFEFPCLLAYGERTQAIRPELMQYGYKSFGGLPAPEPGKFFVYVLELENGHRYIGMTDFILKRYHEHVTEVGAKYTLQHKPVNIIHWEKLASKQEAAVREQWLKTGFGRKWLDREEKANRLRQAGGKMVDLSAHAMQAGSELREIPEGWKVGKISDFGEVVCGKTPPKSNPDYFGGKTPFIKIPDMHDKTFIVKTEDTLSDEGQNFQQNKTLPKFSLCVSCIATVGLVCITSEESQTNQQINSIIPNELKHLSCLYFQLRKMERKLIDYASGGSATPNLNTGDFANLSVVHPGNDLLNLFSSHAWPLFEQILMNDLENINLEKMRDSLLPRLMSGKIRVN